MDQVERYLEQDIQLNSRDMEVKQLFLELGFSK